MGKITAYKVNNLSKVDLRFYKEGDHFITPRSVGMLTNGKMKTLQDQSDLMTELNDLKNRVKALEEIGRNLFANTTNKPVVGSNYSIVIQPITEMPKDMEKVTLSFLYRTSKNYDRNAILIFRHKDGVNKMEITSATPLKKSPENWSLFTKTFDFDYDGKDFDSLRLYQYPSGSVGEIEYKNLKLEKGTKATGWKPAPEDL